MGCFSSELQRPAKTWQNDGRNSGTLSGNGLLLYAADFLLICLLQLDTSKTFNHLSKWVILSLNMERFIVYERNPKVMKTHAKESFKEILGFVMA